MYGAGLHLLRFFFLKRIIILTVLLREQLFQIFRWLAGNVLHGNALADIGGVVRMALRGVDIQIPDEPVVNDKALGFIFARSLHLVHVDVIDTLVSQRYAYCGASHAWPHSFHRIPHVDPRPSGWYNNAGKTKRTGHFTDHHFLTGRERNVRCYTG